MVVTTCDDVGLREQARGAGVHVPEGITQFRHQAANSARHRQPETRVTCERLLSSPLSWLLSQNRENSDFVGAEVCNQLHGGWTRRCVCSTTAAGVSRDAARSEDRYNERVAGRDPVRPTDPPRNSFQFGLDASASRLSTLLKAPERQSKGGVRWSRKAV
jgi:hypothetical protein